MNPTEIKPEIELSESEGICTECKIEGKVFEFVIFIGYKPIETGAKYCEVCIEKYLQDE